jgi:hypothetical protein
MEPQSQKDGVCSGIALQANEPSEMSRPRIHVNSRKYKDLYWAHASGYFKIGVANNVQSRMIDLRVANPMIKLLAIVRKGGVYEYEIHQRLSEWNVAGEWFSENPVTMSFMYAFIDALLGIKACSIIEGFCELMEKSVGCPYNKISNIAIEYGLCRPIKSGSECAVFENVA